MSQILELYKDLIENEERFIDEVFKDEIYKIASPQLTIIDLGAYQGEYSFYSYPFAKVVYAVEADPRPFEVMHNKINSFHMQEIIKDFNIAISGLNGKRLFRNSGYGGSALQSVDTPKALELIEVDSMTLKEFFDLNKIEHVDILKVDVESAEPEIFTSPDFTSIAPKIDLIIGEHFQGLEPVLSNFGFKETIYPAGYIYRK